MASFYISTPIYYVNDIPHLGHAYTTIVADVLARYHRARGEDVFFLTGTDEHGQKIERAALARQEQPLQLADRVVQRFQETWQNLNIRNDDFIRTTEERHQQVVQELWQRLSDAGDIYLGEYEGLYCVGCEEYFTAGQAGEGETCPVHGQPLEHLQQPSYFFRMSSYQDRLLQHFAAHPDFVQPEIRRNEILSFIKSGLHDLSISRTTFNWGIEVPGDPKHVMYVWVDALTNYISALGGFSAAVPRYTKFWPADMHLIGKDILRFHAVYWPTMLMAAGLPLPRRIFAHGWWTVNGQKMSKTLRNTVEPNMVAADVGCDALRYFLLRETPLGNDGDFSHQALFGRINAELANDLGNLLHRSLAMARMYCNGQAPEMAAPGEIEAMDQEFISLAQQTADEAARHFQAPAPHRALESIWVLVRGANKYIDKTAPFKLAKDPAKRRRVEVVVANFLEALRWISLLVAPVMPDKATEIRQQLGLGAADEHGQLQNWPTQWTGLPAGLMLPGGSPLFPRLDDEAQAALTRKWTQTAPSVKKEDKKMDPETQTSQITFDEFSRLDLRVAQVLEAGRVEGADRLLKLTIDLGTEQRQVVAGIAEVYTPEELLGRQVIFLANLKPAKIRGVESQGMILAAGDKKVLALSALDREVPVGTKIR